MSGPGTPSRGDLLARLPELTLRDENRLRRRLDGQRGHQAAGRAHALSEIAAEVETAEARVAARRAAVPAVSYPEQLPVSRRKDEVLAALRENQVVVLSGETGSGKTTQLPKICLELGRGVRGMIGHTQPRRIAARSVADRVAEELGIPLGSTVGYAVRFSDSVSDTTLVKVMTDGILLAEISSDPLLRRYDTLILDEAHERSLTIDFLLGYVHSILPRRPDLKVVITSATIDSQRFSEHFGGAPVIEVTGRTYPVEVRYRPLVAEAGPGEEPFADPAERDQVSAIGDAVAELRRDGPGDVLVFLSGEREIRDTAEALAGDETLEVLPLYARLSAAEQSRVFTPSRGNRVVLATNVAETSLTVPGVRYVVDPGTARISRYSRRTKVQRLPIEAISRASADQRAGRCGRVADGTCIRLYSEADYLGRPEFPDPEILRTSLASVLLRMASLGLGDVTKFPFVDPPDNRSLRDGVALLVELGALETGATESRVRLTPLGRRLARLPIDPRLARMVLEAERRGCVHEVLVIASAMSIQDPRERPSDREAAAVQSHARFADPTSDFAAYLNLWSYLAEQQQELSSSAFRRMCRREFLHYLRIREWQDLYGQLRRSVRSMNIPLDDGAAPADPAAVRMSLLAGLLSQIGRKDSDGREYLGARGARFVIAPGSSMTKKPPAWVVAGELVETSRLFARTVARISPEEVEPLAEHLLKRSYSEPHWSAERGGAVASEKVMLFGLPLVAARTVDYGRIDPEWSRELFLRHGLVEGEWSTPHAFLAKNRERLADVEELEHRARRRDLLVDEDKLFDFYDARVPADVTSGRHFDSWWKKARRSDPDLLTFPTSLLVSPDAPALNDAEAPAVWEQGDLRLPLSYVFEPGSDDDGVTATVPVAVLGRLDADDVAWQVPALRHDLVTALLRSLPKGLRVHFVPAPDVAARVLRAVAPRSGRLPVVLSRALAQLTGVTVPPEEFALDRLPSHLRMTFRVVDDAGRTLAEGKDLEALRARLRPQVAEAITSAAGSLERTGLTDWTIGTLPRSVARSRADGAVVGYPALVDEGRSVAVRVLSSPTQQGAAMWQGTRRLLLLTLPSTAKALLATVDNRAKLTLARSPHGSVAALVDDCVICGLDAVLVARGGPVWDEAGFVALREAVRASLPATAADVLGTVSKILRLHATVAERLRAPADSSRLPSLLDMRGQLAGLVGPGFATAVGYRRLPDLVRYLQAMEVRLDRLAKDPGRDRNALRVIEDLSADYRKLFASVPPGRQVEVQRVRWMIEELRVGLFAHPMRTAHPVSEQRILRVMDELAS